VVAPPHLTLTVTPPGGAPTDYTTHLAWANAQQQMTITQNFGRQGDTSLLPLVEDYAWQGSPTLAIRGQSQVSLYDNIAAQNLFSGVANSVTQTVIVNKTLNEWDLGCVDYTLYAENKDVHGIFYGWTVDQIVVSLVAQADCGITAATVADGGYIEPGPQLASYVLNFNPLSTAWRQLANLAGSTTPWGWYVDQNLELHFFPGTEALSSGVTFTTTATAPGSLTEGHILLDTQNAYQQDGTSLSNRILVQGANQTTSYGSTSDAPTDTWRADGAQSAWPLRYTVSGTPVLHIGGVVTTVVVAQSGTMATGPWTVGQNSIGQYFLIAASTPSAGTVIQIWYTYLVPVVAQASDQASINQYTGPNGGVYGQFVSDSSLTTVPMALARAQQMRTEYAFVVERFTFNTSQDWIGWVRAGWSCFVVNQFAYDIQSSTWGVSDTFVIVANTVTFGDGGYRTMQLTTVRI
jgi:hypothetical protein